VPLRTRMRRLVPRLRPGSPARAVTLSLALALLLVVAARPEPLGSGPRPPVSLLVPDVVPRTSAPAPYVGPDFSTLPFTDAQGRPGTWVVAPSALPLQVVVEEQAVRRFGLEAIQEALTVWNDTPGSTFRVRVVGTVDDGVARKRADGVNRVFMDQRDCGERFLARAHLFGGVVEARGQRSVNWVEEIDIGLCDRLSPQLLQPVVRHEVAHVAGMGHLCDVGSECWVPGMGEDNRCRLMNPASYPCQNLSAGDEAGLAYLHPELPRVSGDTRVGTAAAVSFLTFPRRRAEHRVILSPVDGPTELQAAAAVLAALEGVPHLLVPETCTEGPGGEELNRVASIAATAVLVGPVATACRDDLRVGWEFQIEELGDLRAVTDAVVAQVGAPDRLVLTDRPPAPEEQEGVPDVALAVPAAAQLGAPLLTTGADRLDGLVSDVLAAVPSIRGVVVVGDERTVSDEVATELAMAGVRVRRLDAVDRVDVGLKLSRMRDAFGPDPQRTVLVAAGRPGDAIAAGTLAASLGVPVVPVVTGPASPGVRVGDYLAARVNDGFVVGGVRSIDVPLFIRLNRAVDGAR
jgi:hypothetical protein